MAARFIAVARVWSIAAVAVACTATEDGAIRRSTAPANVGGAVSGESLSGTAWQLVKFQGGDGTTLVPDGATKYTLAFAADGSLSARIDCNQGRGTWKSSGPNHLELGPMALTRAMCPPGSLHDRIVRQLPYVRSYVIKNGRLFLSLMADGGIYEFAPGGE